MVPISEHITRLTAARLQCDIMRTTTVLIARTDAESASLISSDIDPRDQEDILGIVMSEDDLPLADVIAAGRAQGKTPSELDELETEWSQLHQLLTFDEGKV